MTAEKQAQEAFDELREKVLWQSFPAVQNDQVYVIGDKWPYDDIVSSNLLVDEFPRLLKQKDMKLEK